jgi:hypothetical protein
MASVDAEKLVTESVVWLNTRSLDLPTAIQLGAWLAAKVNAVKGLKGLQKQELVCRVVSDVVQRTCPEGAARDGLLEAVKVALPAALSVAVDAANGRLSLKKVTPSCFAKGLLCFARAAVDVAEAAGAVQPHVAKKIEAGLDQAEVAVLPALPAVAEAVQKAVLPEAAEAAVPPTESQPESSNPESQTPQTNATKEGDSETKPTDGESQKEEVRVEFL